MDLDSSNSILDEIFYPFALQKTSDAQRGRAKFAYFTQHDTALKVLVNKELWFRNAQRMNDFSEIRYGMGLIYSAFASPIGNALSVAIDDVFEGVAEEVGQNIGKFADNWINETYIACLSELHPHEERIGRLSMWREYGKTAIVINTNPLVRSDGESAIRSIPVQYPTNEEYQISLQTLTNQLVKHQVILRNQGREWFTRNLTRMFFNTAVGTKHPGFAEEREWRLYFRDNQGTRPEVSKKLVSIGDNLEAVFVLDLQPRAELGLDDSGLVNILSHVIVGPTTSPNETQQELVKLLATSGYSNPEMKVLVSDIPLRTKEPKSHPKNPSTAA